MSGRKKLLCLLFFAAIAVSSFSQVLVTYGVSHTFNFKPKGDVVQGTWRYADLTNAWLPQDPCSTPGPGWMPMPANNVMLCTSSAPNAFSVATSWVNTTNWKPGNVSGAIGVLGWAGSTGGAAYSYAASGVTVQGGRTLRSGNIAWGPALTMTVAGSALAGTMIRDPITFDVYNPGSNTSTAGMLLGIESSLTGTGTFSWQNNLFSLNASTFDFDIFMDSPYTKQQGLVDFEVANGKVVLSMETGIFAGLLPKVGSRADFTVPFINDIDFDYDLGSLGGNNPDVSISFDDGGQASVSGTQSSTPEPSTLLLWGSGLLAFWAGSRNGVLR